jgi:hypothetical protein
MAWSLQLAINEPMSTAGCKMRANGARDRKENDMDRRERQALDRYLTGGYGEDQLKEKMDVGAYPYSEEGDFDPYPNVSGHLMAFLNIYGGFNGVYEYDPTDDGPEVEIIKAVLWAERF